MSEKPLIEMELDELNKSIREVKKNIKKAENIAIQAMADAAVLVAFDLLGEGMRRAPKDTGHLRGSGVALVNRDQVARTVNESGQARIVKEAFSQRVSRTLKEILGQVAFNTEYAAKQHEETSYNHTDGEAKYLERPLLEKAEYYVEFMSEKVKAALGG